MSRLRSRRGGLRGRVYVPPRPVYVETVVPAAPCCACCGNRIDDAGCLACAPSSANVGDPNPSPASSAPASQVAAQAQGAGAGALILLLAVFFALNKDRAFF
jgi:hypothetical protein